MSEKQVVLMKAVREALLMIVDAIEVFLEMERTSEMRKTFRKLTYKNSCQTTEV